MTNVCKLYHDDVFPLDHVIMCTGTSFDLFIKGHTTKQNYPAIFLILLSELWRNEKMSPACLKPPAFTCKLLIEYEYFAFISH